MLIIDILSDIYVRVIEFGVNLVLNLLFLVVVKIGIFLDFCDIWIVGFIKDYIVGVWVGNFSGKFMMLILGIMGVVFLWN